MMYLSDTTEFQMAQDRHIARKMRARGIMCGFVFAWLAYFQAEQARRLSASAFPNSIKLNDTGVI